MPKNQIVDSVLVVDNTLSYAHCTSECTNDPNSSQLIKNTAVAYKADITFFNHMKSTMFQAKITKFAF